MHKKRGIFFTIDAILAAGIFLVLILLISNVYVSDTPTQQVRFYSQDTLRLFTELKINEVDSDYVRDLIGSGTITELNNTVLEQVGDFWAENDIDNAEGLMKNLTDALIPQNYGVGVYVDEEVIYARQRSIGRTLISSRKIISGVAEGVDEDELPGLWGPVVVEFRVWETTDLKDLVCLQTDVSCGTYPTCNNCDSQDSYSSNYCSGNSILRDFSDYSCASSSCTSSTNPQTVENCASNNGICQSANCACADTGSSCGTYPVCTNCGTNKMCYQLGCLWDLNGNWSFVSPNYGPKRVNITQTGNYAEGTMLEPTPDLEVGDWLIRITITGNNFDGTLNDYPGPGLDYSGTIEDNGNTVDGYILDGSISIPGYRETG